MFDSLRDDLVSLGLPRGDDFSLAESSSTFSDLCHYRIEVATVNTVEAVERLINKAAKKNIVINRITETKGLFRHTREEIRDYVSLCKGAGVQLLMSIGPRACYDTSATSRSPAGKTVAYRLRGQEQLVRALADLHRGLELGVRGFVIYDEGLLWALGKLRMSGKLPSDIWFKLSAHCGHANPASMVLLELLGADSINPCRDLDMPMISALRRAVKTPLDIHADNPKESGGFIRFYEVPEIVRVASPVYLKVGNSAISNHGQDTTLSNIDGMIRNIEIVKEFICKYSPELKQSLGS